MRKLFNKNKGNPLFAISIASVILFMVLGVPFLINAVITIIVLLIITLLNGGLWKGDLLYIIIACLILAVGYSFPEWFNLELWK